MNGKIRFTWIAAVVAAFALTASTFAAQQVTENENTTNKVSHSRVSASRDSKSKKVNINTASKSELESLPGVGPSIADNIIAARPFKTVRDLKTVTGIGDQRFNEIQPHVTVGSSARAHTDTSLHAGSAATASSDYASGSGKPTAQAQSRNVIPPGSGAAPGANAAVTTDTVHSGSDKPGAREKEEARANRSSTSSSGRSATSRTGAKVNLNTASKDQLEALPGIGPVKAQAIIDNRPYNSPEDVMKVKGIKEGTYDQIKDQITVR
jgi:competence protein ComEA